jgi:hypothetical protein
LIVLLAQAAFYSGARAVLKVLGHLVERGDVDELERKAIACARGLRYDCECASLRLTRKLRDRLFSPDR